MSGPHQAERRNQLIAEPQTEILDFHAGAHRATEIEPVSRDRLTAFLSGGTTSLALVGAVALSALFLNLGGPDLWDPDEGRHAEIAREMLAGGNWITLTFNFEPYVNKPAFFYWLAALSMKAIGVGATGARLPSAAWALCCALTTWWWGRRFFDPLTGTLAALILLTAGMFPALGRFVVLDMTFTWWLTAALFYSSAWYIDGRERGWPIWPVYVALGLAMLTKGPAAPALAALVWLGFLARTGGLAAWRAFRPLHGAAIILVLAGSWYATAAVVSPSYIWHFLWTENIGRFATAQVGHTHLGRFAFFYYLPVLFLPWGAYLPAVVARAWSSRPGLTPAREFCLWWIAVILLFFTISTAKLGTYILPVFPALALLTADALADTFRRQALFPSEALCHRLAGWLITAAFFVLPIAALGFLAWTAPRILPLGLLLLPVWWPAWRGLGWLRAQRYDLAVLAVVGGTALALAGACIVVVPTLDEVFSLRRAAQLIRTLPAEAQVLAMDSIFASLVFYSERKVTAVDQPEVAAAVLKAPTPAVLLTKERMVDRLRCEMSGDVFVWWRGNIEKLLIANRPPPDGAPVETLTALPAAQCAAGTRAR